LSDTGDTGSDDSSGPAGQQVPLGVLLAEAVAGVVQAQRVLDEDAQSRVHSYFDAPQGETVLPPLWFTFGQVKIELELASAVARAQGVPSGTPVGRREVQLMGRMLNPTAVSLFGYAASSGLRVSLTLEPRGLRAETVPAPAPGPAPAPTPLPPS
jgi:hypothetical protein